MSHNQMVSFLDDQLFLIGSMDHWKAEPKLSLVEPLMTSSRWHQSFPLRMTELGWLGIVLSFPMLENPWKSARWLNIFFPINEPPASSDLAFPSAEYMAVLLRIQGGHMFHGLGAEGKSKPETRGFYPPKTHGFLLILPGQSYRTLVENWQPLVQTCCSFCVIQWSSHVSTLPSAGASHLLFFCFIWGSYFCCSYL